MAQKIIHMPAIGTVTLQKRRGSRSIRLSIGAGGSVKVTLPNWTPYGVAETFVRAKTDWVLQHQANKKQHTFSAGDCIGKNHRLQFIQEYRGTVATRVTQTRIIIRLPLAMHATDTAAQTAVQKAAMRALKQEASELLPGRLQQLAADHNFDYKSVAIKQLKSRWGSCSSDKDIALNCYLMQLPWELIDYVLLHELMHTQIMAHGSRFWKELDKHVKSLSTKRIAMKAHQPALKPQREQI